jgi:tetratricopeptide (TPR) repeat protein
MAHANLGSALLRQGKQEEAVACFKKAIELDPKDFGAHLNLGRVLREQGKFDEAIAEYREAIENYPKDVAARRDMAVLLATCPDPKFRDPRLAVEHAKKAVVLQPQDTMAWQILGWAQYRAGAWRESIEALEKSCKLEAGTGDAGQWIVMALAYGKLANEKELPEQERTRHKAEARRWYDEAVKQINAWGPGGNSIMEATRAFRAEAAELLGVNQDLKSLEMLVAAQPNVWEPRVNLAQAYANEGLWEKAAAEYTKATEVKPDAWEPWSRRAFFHFNRQQWDKAVADFSRAIELAPQVHTNWWHRGHAYLQLAQWDKAAADFGIIVDRWPDGAEGWYLRGVAFAQLKQPDKALADLRQAIAKGFKHVEWLASDTRLDPLRSNDEFKKLRALSEKKEK